jgi:hypothetical protein
VERIFVILSREIADVRRLLDAFRLSSVARVPTTELLATADLRKHLAPRDLRLKSIAEPESPDERPFTTYAVALPPRIFLEIALRHE